MCSTPCEKNHLYLSRKIRRNTILNFIFHSFSDAVLVKIPIITKPCLFIKIKVGKNLIFVYDESADAQTTKAKEVHSVIISSSRKYP